MSAPARWLVQHEALHADCRVFRVYKEHCHHPLDHREGDFFVLRANDWVLALPVTAEGRLVLVRRAAARGAHAFEQYEVAAVGLDGGVGRARPEQAGAAAAEAGLLLGLAGGGHARIFVRFHDAAGRFGREVARAEAVLPHHHDTAVVGDGEREHPVAGTEHKEITLPMIERVMAAFFENPENPAVGVELFVPDGPARGRRHAWLT